MNKVFISNYSNTKHFVNDEKVLDNEQAFTYDGKHAEMFLNRNGTIVYERLDNHDLHKLLDIDYEHKNSLVDKLEMLLPKKRRHTRKRRHTPRRKHSHKKVKKHRRHHTKKRPLRIRNKRSKTRSRK